ncbi:phage portal protein [Microbacterium sp. MPKO10]|uniref:phage portal protein n=1 Tax=Microbacterium sp. MPKO10 TaxID=2989818 RepID=UPI0022361DB6|nr:phage portal protein [Microbacterium sp. MPKO10]MCW4458178.1 phage portal protein [Microbacterium sp. MPKO10]
MRGIGAALGWVGKGVHAVTDRSRFEGFVSSGDSDDPFDLQSLMWDNRFKIEFPAATVSSAVHGCSFITVTEGDTASGEPDVLMLARAAEDSAAIWDKRKRALKAFLSVVEVDDSGKPSEMVMYTPGSVYSMVKTGNKWVVDERVNRLGVVSVAPLVHKFELRRPLGHSRITRAAMYYADAALRTVVRAEVSAEFYSAPEYYLFGADVSSFIGDDKWTALMGRIKALDVEDGDDKPDLHRFTGASPQPHTDQLRMWASQFADDQDLEVKFADSSNPSSADAIFAAKETLITTTRDANELWGHGAVEAMQMAVRLRGKLDAVPDEMKSLSAQFTDPAIVSPSARADAFSKLSANIDGFGASEVGMEYAGLTREQIIRFQAEQRRVQALQLVQGLGVAAGSALNDPAMGSGVAGEVSDDRSAQG